jgi:serine/threonine-protein kinase
MRDFFGEIKRRNVFRVALVYIVAGWLTMQVVDVMFPALQLPQWMVTAVAALVLIGFPFALIFAWAFEITPEGLKREKDVDRSSSITPQTGRKLNQAALIILAIAVAFLLFDKFMLRGGVEPAAVPAASTADEITQSPEQPSIAVLPFVNMSADSDNEYFSDGLSEELLNVLAKIPELHVAGRTSSFAFKGKNQDLREIGQQLNVSNILEGSVRKSNTRLRITAQLVNTQNGYHLWSETYDREIDDIFAVQDEIARAVADALRVALLGTQEDVKHGTDSVAAYEQYLQARYFFNLANAENYRKAFDALNEAIRLDPEYAGAYALLAELQMSNTGGYVNNGEDFVTGYRKARDYADKAVSLDPDLAAARIAKGRSYLQADWDFDNARVELEKALALEPGNERAMFAMSEVHALHGDTLAGTQLLEQALRIDPLAVAVRRYHADFLVFDGKFEEAIAEYRELLQMNADLARINGRIGQAYLFAGDHDQAADYFAREPVDWAREFGEILLLTRTAEPAAWRAAAERYAEKWGTANSAQLAEIYAFGGDADRAFEWIATAEEVHDPGIIWLKSLPAFEPVRDDPRWNDQLARLGLAE